VTDFLAGTVFGVHTPKLGKPFYFAWHYSSLDLLLIHARCSKPTMKISRVTPAFALIIALAQSISPAVAATTPINPQGSGSGGERCLAGALCPGGGSYGGSGSLLGIFENETGKGSFTRVDDTIDTVWKAAGTQPVMIRALARYAGDNSVFGIDGGSGFTPLAVAPANGRVLVSDPADYAGQPRATDFLALPAGGGWHSLAVPAGETFAFILRNLTTGYSLSSDPGFPGHANSGKNFLDYMVTWQVNDSIPHYFIAWEDRDPRNNSMTDYDYNDIVVEVLFAQPALFLDSPASLAPEPATLALLLFGIPAILGYARRNRRSK